MMFGIMLVTISQRLTLKMVLLVFLSLAIFFVTAKVTVAYEAILHTPAEPFVVKEIQPPFSSERWYLSTINQFPHMYALTLLSDTSLTLSLRVPADIDLERVRPELILVQDVAEGRVEEIVRMDFNSLLWAEERDKHSRLMLYTSEALDLDLPAGKYRLEISSASDQSKYMLVVGTDKETESFFTSFSTVRTMHNFYEVSPLLMVRTPLVYCPIGIMLLIALMGVTWRYRGRLQLQ